MTKTCAMVDEATGRVVNLIVADPERDNPWPGHILVVIDADRAITTQWGWTEDKGFYPVDSDLIEKLRQQDEEDKKAAAVRPYLLDD